MGTLLFSYLQKTEEVPLRHHLDREEVRNWRMCCAQYSQWYRKRNAKTLNNKAHFPTVLHEKFSKEVNPNLCVESWCSRWMYAGWDRADGETSVLDLIEQSRNSSYRDLINVAINTSVSGWLLHLNPYTAASLRQEKEKVWIYEQPSSL